MLGIIDYGAGNLKSVYNALAYLGYEAVVSAEPDKLDKTQALILPGVGSFRRAMDSLEDTGLIPFIHEQVAEGRFFLGICLGLQLLFSTGYEDGKRAGLDMIPGEVVRFDLEKEYKVPHVGWNGIRFERSDPLFAGLSSETYQYFVHSYCVRPDHREDILAQTDYGGEFVSAVSRGRIYGVQFHPEKSGEAGLRILNNFGRMVYAADSSS